MCGIRVAIKWVTRIFAPIVVLGFVAIISLIMYRGLYHDDWALIFDPKQRWLTAQMFGILPFVYLVPCFWASLFSSLIYCARHAATLRNLTNDSNV